MRSTMSLPKTRYSIKDPPVFKNGRSTSAAIARFGTVFGGALAHLAAEVRALTGEEFQAALGKDGALYLTLGAQNPQVGPLGTPA